MTATKEFFNYGIIAILEDPTDKDFVSVAHFAGYKRPPTKIDFKLLEEELKTDPSFGLINKEFSLVPCPPEILEHFRNGLKG